jgi:5-(carboxyamino)imidazole ribonucleotide mutase
MKGWSTMKVAVIMGSISDLEIVRKAVDVFKFFGVEYEIRILSAHRTPDEVTEYVSGARDSGVDVIIGAAGKAAHLPGVIASKTVIPVIGLPIESSFMGGLDSLLSIVRMPAGIAVATVGTNASENAALLAVQMLSLRDGRLADRMVEYRDNQRRMVLKNNEFIDL